MMKTKHFAVLVSVLSAVESHALTPTTNWNTECARAEKSVSEAKADWIPAKRLQEMKTILVRIIKLDEQIAQHGPELSESFLRNCMRKSFESFSAHRKFMPPGERMRGDYLFVIGSYHEHLGDLKEANRYFDQALNASPDDIELRWHAFKVWLALISDSSGQATQASLQAVETNRDLDSLVARTRALIDPFLKAKGGADLRKRQIEALEFYAKFLELTHNDAQAFVQWRSLLALTPNHKMAGAKVITYYMARKDYVAARPVLERFSAEKNPEPYYVENLARIHILQKKPLDALKTLDAHVHGAQATSAMQGLFLRAMADLGRVEEAAGFLNALPPERRRDSFVQQGESALLIARARMNLKQGLKGQAVADLRTHLAAHPDDLGISFEVAKILASSGVAQDQTEAARLTQPFVLKQAMLSDEQLDTALKVLTSSPEFAQAGAAVCDQYKKERDSLPLVARMGCIEAWIKQGRKEDARRELEDSIKRTKGSTTQSVFRRKLTEL